MKQIFQSLRSGAVQAADVPAPRAGRGQLLIRSRASLISAGTEKMLLDFGRGSWLSKVRQQPDKVRDVLRKLRTDGFAATWEAVTAKLDRPLTPGYCNAGVVVEVGAGVAGFSVGDRVVSNGAHAELVGVPQNLCARIPDGVRDVAAAFAVPGAIALQGLRLAECALGECVVVSGLGLIGLLAVQLLRAQGCRVLGLDFDAERLALARRFGAEVVDLRSDDALAAAQAFSRGRGVDAVLVCAATKSSEPMTTSARMCRKRGRIVLVGVAGLELSRADFYEKELTFQVSCSYGPGRYDPDYEQGGHDYPIGFVRWTAQRNFEAVLDLIAAGRLDVEPLVSHRFPLSEAAAAYALLGSDAPSLGILFDYPDVTRPIEIEVRTIGVGTSATATPVPPVVGCIGAGEYATRVLLPAFRAAGASLRSVASLQGASAVQAAKKFGIGLATTDIDGLLADTTLDTVVIATRHDSHAQLVCRALEAGKHVFVEKPLCLDTDDLERIAALAAARPLQRLMVGFNRRFAPTVVQARGLLAGLAQPKACIVTVNAGALPPTHWTRGEPGGGRIVGEACHHVDLLRFLVGAPIAGVRARRLQETPPGDSASIDLDFADGSVGTIHYFANGDRGFPKERVDVFCAGKILQIDNYRTLRSWGHGALAGRGGWSQDKGQQACVAAFVAALRTGAAAPIALDEILDVSRASIEAQRSCA